MRDGKTDPILSEAEDIRPAYHLYPRDKEDT
jgi:hypothetical protein